MKIHNPSVSLTANKNELKKGKQYNKCFSPQQKEAKREASYLRDIRVLFLIPAIHSELLNFPSPCPGDTSDHTCACRHTLRANFFAQALSVKLVSFTKDLHYHSNIILNFFHL